MVSRYPFLSCVNTGNLSPCSSDRLPPFSNKRLVTFNTLSYLDKLLLALAHLANLLIPKCKFF